MEGPESCHQPWSCWLPEDLPFRVSRPATGHAAPQGSVHTGSWSPYHGSLPGHLRLRAAQALVGGSAGPPPYKGPLRVRWVALLTCGPGLPRFEPGPAPMPVGHRLRHHQLNRLLLPGRAHHHSRQAQVQGSTHHGAGLPAVAALDPPRPPPPLLKSSPVLWATARASGGSPRGLGTSSLLRCSPAAGSRIGTGSASLLRSAATGAARRSRRLPQIHQLPAPLNGALRQASGAGSMRQSPSPGSVAKSQKAQAPTLPQLIPIQAGGQARTKQHRVGRAYRGR
ncbi:hypothetical protein NDU88_005010 [Pleurodeles waltl]|uniref:Uncharacterized protein n=1 Tax=Pleurodeles waltl TaxID=8319 RepID=A0AAV7TTK9_PLEWA|nr:hypothetical protein NDU88_005010 [Pleurodeles waltl]